jgi:hypothetical protein
MILLLLYWRLMALMGNRCLAGWLNHHLRLLLMESARTRTDETCWLVVYSALLL